LGGTFKYEVNVKLHNILGVVGGLAAFAASALLAICAKYSDAYWQLMLIGITAILALLGLEFFHYGLGSQGKKYRFFSRGLRGLFFDLLHLSLAVLLTLATINHQRSSDPMCGGGLSGGFPLAFLCDNAGESPISDWGKISFHSDIPNLFGAFVDILFYMALLWIISFTTIRIIQMMNQRMQFRQ
jgi:hypothetical protein